MSQDALTRAVANAVRDAVASPDVPADPGAVQPISEAVTPIIAHATNAEDWWRSRVTIGSLTGIVGGIITIATGIAAGSTDAELYAGGIGALIGGSFALYGRWIATRPLGR